jgi:hypothetical protein
MELFNLSKFAQEDSLQPPAWTKQYGVGQTGLFVDLAYPYDANSEQGIAQSDSLREELMQAAINGSAVLRKAPLEIKLYDAWRFLSPEVRSILVKAYLHTHGVQRESA